MSRPSLVPWISLPLCAAAVPRAQAESFSVANPSFESPEVIPPFPVETRIDSWMGVCGLLFAGRRNRM